MTIGASEIKIKVHFTTSYFVIHSAFTIFK